MAATKYFIYSSEQLKLRKSVEAKMGKTFKCGTVIVNGTRKLFTELSTKPISRFSDAIIVAQGDPTLMKYTLPEGG